MGQDELLKTALIGYEITAGKLSRNEAVSEEELRKFLGLTGMLSVKMMQQLWTQEELEKKIEDGVKSRCATCDNKKTIDALVLAVQKPTLVQATQAHEPPQNVRTMLAVAFAENMKTFIICVVTALSVAIIAAIVSGRIAEVAAAVATTSQAIQSK